MYSAVHENDSKPNFVFSVILLSIGAWYRYILHTKVIIKDYLLYYMTVTRENMAVMDAGSTVNVSVSISTNTIIQHLESSKDVSARGSNYGSHHRRSAGSRSWNTRAKGLFWRCSRVSICIWTGKGKQLPDFTVDI